MRLLLPFWCSCLLLFSNSPLSVLCSGFFELQILDAANNSRFHLCLKEFWISGINSRSGCTFGEKETIFVNNLPINAIKIWFTFRWIGSFSAQITVNESEVKLIADEHSIPNSDHWKTRTSDSFAIRYRVACDQYYHSSDCATFCRSRDDTFGHYTCDKNGKKVCIEGWIGVNCDKPKCREGCNEMHGYCERPDECQCRVGWKGKHCSECVEYPGCLHGYCASPFQCICHRNWGGILCDQDLNYCGTHEPCLNDGQCENIAPDNYRCVCKKGFAGINCQTVVDACATNPCLHGGQCISKENGSSFECLCREGFRGARCQDDVNECDANPCQNGATCHNLHNEFRCTCSPGWTGSTCDIDIDECTEHMWPCIRARQCINTRGGYTCACERGFTGVTCETEIDDCARVTCENGGTCLDLVADFRCACRQPFTGIFCERIDEMICSHINDPNNTLWHFHDKSCPSKTRVCACDHRSYVICTCAQMSDRECDLSGGGNEIQIRSEVNTPLKELITTCDVISSLLSLKNREDMISDDVCCHISDNNDIYVKTANEDTMRVLMTHMNKVNFAHLRSVDMSSNVNYVVVVVICVATLMCATVVLVLSLAAMRVRRHRTQQNTCGVQRIQNNLKDDTNTTTTSSARSAVNNNKLRDLI